MKHLQLKNNGVNIRKIFMKIQHQRGILQFDKFFLDRDKQKS